MTLFVIKGLLFIAFMETAFPSYTVYKQQEDGTVISYGISKKSVDALMDESGMIDTESLCAITNSDCVPQK